MCDLPDYAGVQAMIQSRGRARVLDSRMVLLVEKDNLEHTNYIKNVQRQAPSNPSTCTPLFV